MKNIYTVILIAIVMLAGWSCNDSTNKLNSVAQKPQEVWFKQASVDLGAKIVMANLESGFAISRGKGEDVTGKVLQFEKGKWQTISEHSYSDFPIVTNFNSKTIWWVTHETHNGNYKPHLFSLSGNSKSEIQLPKIMWDNVDYSMWTAISVLPNGKAWMVGQQGNIIFFDGSKWIEQISPVKRRSNENFSAGDLQDIQMLSENSGWAVGKQGIILHYKNGTWTKYDSPTTDELKSISMLDDNFGWIVGDRGTILKFQNNKWQKIENNFRVTFNCIKTINKDKAWIAGTRSTMLEFKNNNWVENNGIKIFEDSFYSLDIVRENDNKYNVWVIGDKGIYTNSQSLQFSFTDVTASVSLRKEGRSAIFRDLNNDGYLDIATILEDGPPVIYKNQNGYMFSEVTRNFEINKPGISQTICSADFDNDGNFDFLEILDDVTNKLSFGRGNLDFREVNTSEFIQPTFMQPDLSLACIQTADFNNDGNLDLYVSNYNYEDMLFSNNGAGKFLNVIKNSEINSLINHRSYGITLSDFNMDGLIDILKTYKLPENNQYAVLYINKGNFHFKRKDDPNFKSLSAPSTYSSISNDFNNDGIPDLILFNNDSKLQFLINDGTASFKDVTNKVGLQNKFFHPEPSGGILAAADVNNDGYLDLFIGSRLFLNSPEFKFTEIGSSVGVDFIGNPTFADFDNDGDVDLFIGSSREALGNGDRAVLYRNNLTVHNFIKIKLNGDISNRNAIGAKIFLFGYNNNNKLIYKTLRQNGLGSNAAAQEDFSVCNLGVDSKLHYKAKIIFPSGIVRYVNLKQNTINEISESSFFERAIINFKKSIGRTLLLINWKIETIKFFVAFSILILAFFYGLKTKARKYVMHIYFGLFFLIFYAALIHISITQPLLLSSLLPIGLTSTIAFSFIVGVSKIIEQRESKYISHYKLIEEIGSGGMGKVFKAIDIHSSQMVALKILNPDLLKEQENRKRLAGEGRLLASINHLNVVKVIEFGETDKHAFIAMEYLSGGTLQDFIEQNIPLSFIKVKDIAIQICTGLKEIHNQNIIHRDLKSSNIMFDSEGRIRIMDFGLSKSPLVTTMTTLGTVIGTLGYVAPEQVTSIHVDKRVDIFSFGVILYQMLTGKLPFNGENEIALIHSIFNMEPVPPKNLNSSIPTLLEKITLTCLRKNQNERFNNIEELLAQLEKVNPGLS